MRQPSPSQQHQIKSPSPGPGGSSNKMYSMSKTSSSSVSITRHEKILGKDGKVMTKEELYEEEEQKRREEEEEEEVLIYNNMYQMPKSPTTPTTTTGQQSMQTNEEQKMNNRNQRYLPSQRSIESQGQRSLQSQGSFDTSTSLRRTLDDDEQRRSRSVSKQHQQQQQQQLSNRCGECGDIVTEGEALVALDRSWHVWCFKCTDCGQVLDGEYMGKDGLPYCERDYQKSFGVKCIHCDRYITGKVLQAGDNHHFHPTCARCTKCGDPFGDGEEMFMQGGAIWHPRCGPGNVASETGDRGRRYYKGDAENPAAVIDINSQVRMCVL